MAWSGVRVRIAVVLGLAVALAALLAKKAWLDGEVAYLEARAGAEWIVFPTEPTAVLRRAGALPATFAREFHVEGTSESVRLRARLFRGGEVRLNGVTLELPEPSGANWKSEREVEVGGLVHPGVNWIEARVETEPGPPALWLALEAAEWRLGTDERWLASVAGSAERRARLARTPMCDWSTPTDASAIGAIGSNDVNPRPAAALLEWLPALAACLALAAALVLGARTLARRRGWTWSPGRIAALVTALALAHAALFWNDRALAAEQGFDATEHVEYVRYMAEHGSVPMADEGWEMYQPPLYYAAGAALCRVAGVEASSGSAPRCLRILGWLALALQLASVAGLARELLPERPDLAALATLFAAALPMQLYLFQFTTNEALASALVSLALYLAAREFRRGRESAGSLALIGVVLGAALLTKFSALLAFAGVLAMLALRWFGLRPRSWTSLVRALALVAVPALAVCGWYYARVASRFGSVLVWNLDEATGFAWWQDPGYRVAGDLFRFGRALDRPLFSALAGVPDALYSTLWSDGMLGGSARVDVRPPWNYDGLAAGLGLALPLSLALLVGVALALRRWIRGGATEWSLALGVCGATFAAWLALVLELPTFAQAKAIYASSVVGVLAVAMALGLDRIAGWLSGARIAVWTFFVAWALSSFASFWSLGVSRTEGVERVLVVGGVPGRTDLIAQCGGDARAALELARREVARAPDHVWTHRNLGFVLWKLGEREKAVAALQDALAIDPWVEDVHRLLGAILQGLGNVESAVEHFEWSLRLDPKAASYAVRLAELHERAGRRVEARATLRRTLDALDPGETSLREPVEAALGRLSGEHERP
jgi:tetratricopeptide (TPR) repeat protein